MKYATTSELLVSSTHYLLWSAALSFIFYEYVDLRMVFSVSVWLGYDDQLNLTQFIDFILFVIVLLTTTCLSSMNSYYLLNICIFCKLYNKVYCLSLAIKFIVFLIFWAFWKSPSVPAQHKYCFIPRQVTQWTKPYPFKI